MDERETEVHQIARAAGVMVADILAADADKIRAEIHSKYTDGRSGWLWEHFVGDYIAVNDRGRDLGSWSWPAEYAGDCPVVLFFDMSDDPGMYEFSSGRDLLVVLGECTASEYFVTNRATDYLLCRSHEEFLYGLGRAAAWLDQRRKRVANAEN